MEKGDKPKPKESVAKSTSSSTKVKKQKKPKDKKPKDKKPAKQKQKQKQKQENVQIVKVNVNTSKEEKPTSKPVRKEITKQTTYITLDKPYALQPEEEDLLSITKFIPNPPRDKSSAKVTTLVSNPKNEIPQTNIQEQPIASLKQIPVPIKKKVSAKDERKLFPPVDVSSLSNEMRQKAFEFASNPEQEFIIGKAKPQKAKPKKAKTVEEEQPLIVETSIAKTKERERPEKIIIPSSNSSNIDKTIQNSSINNNEKLEEMLIAEPTVSEKQTGLKINKNIKPKLALKVEQVEEEVITERTPIPTKIEIKKQELRKIESEMRDISTRNPLYDGLKEQRNNLIDEIYALREVKKFITETVPKIIVKETMDDILTKIENKDLTTAASLEEEIYDYSTNTDDANISNPNIGEIINIQNENELEEEFGLTSAQLESYKEDYVMTPKGSVQGLIEKIEKKRGAPIKYTTEEERKQASKEQKKAYTSRKKEEALLKKEQANAIKQMETEIEYEQYIQGNYPPDSLEDMIEKNLINKKQNEQAYAEAMVNEAYSIASGQDLSKVSENELNAFFDPFVGQDIIRSPQIYLTEEKLKPDISSDFASALIDKLSDNNNYNSNQSAQEPQFEFE